MATVTQKEVADLLQLHDKAYRLLLWLDREALGHPEKLAPAIVRALASPTTCAAWLDENRLSLPGELLPEKEFREEFVNLFTSFFSTSFRVGYVTFDDELLESHLTIRTAARQGKPSGLIEVQSLALKHLASSEGVKISDAEARRLAQRKSSQPHLLLWTYIWELSRRAKGKGKGEIVHRIWRELPLEIRKNLNAKTVWDARDELLRIVQDFESLSRQN